MAPVHAIVDVVPATVAVLVGDVVPVPVLALVLGLELVAVLVAERPRVAVVAAEVEQRTIETECNLRQRVRHYSHMSASIEDDYLSKTMDGLHERRATTYTGIC